MAVPPNEPMSSDTEGQERPVRERLRNTSIAGTVKNGSALASDDSHTTSLEPTAETALENGTAPSASTTGRGRSQRKRSHDDLEGSDAEEEPALRKGRHGRKRSRDSTEQVDDEHAGKRKVSGEKPPSVTESEDKANTASVDGNDEITAANVTSPAIDAPTQPAGEEPSPKRSKTDRKNIDASKTAANSEPETKPIHTDEDLPPTKTQPSLIPSGSGFSNTSAASPFTALAGKKSPTESASTSAFATSGFGALAGSSTSGFGALAKSSGLNSFASPPASGAPESATKDSSDSSKPATKSAFGGALGAASPFASAGAGTSAFGSGASSGFGKLGGGFSGGFGGGFGGMGGSKLSSFASSGTPGVIGSSKTGFKAFGATDEDDGDDAADDDDEAGVKSPQPEEDQKDERFFAQDSELIVSLYHNAFTNNEKSRLARKTKLRNTRVGQSSTTLSPLKEGKRNGRNVVWELYA